VRDSGATKSTTFSFPVEYEKAESFEGREVVAEVSADIGTFEGCDKKDWMKRKMPCSRKAFFF
jgi:hypothetical protein